MMIASNITFLQFAIVVLVLVTRATTGKVAQSMDEASENYHDQRNPSSPLPHPHHQTNDDSKQAVIHNDDDDDDNNNDDQSSSNSDEKYLNDLRQWSDLASKHYPKKIIRASGGASNVVDSRLWAIPYRFGKRSAMPYRFGKRAAMHFRLGKKSASL